MNKDRIEGSLEQAKGKVKEIVGKATGDASSKRRQDPAGSGKMQNTVGGLRTR